MIICWDSIIIEILEIPETSLIILENGRLHLSVRRNLNFLLEEPSAKETSKAKCSSCVWEDTPQNKYWDADGKVIFPLASCWLCSLWCEEWTTVVQKVQIYFSCFSEVTLAQESQLLLHNGSKHLLCQPGSCIANRNEINTYGFWNETC